jgi:hypothetical protein
VVEDELEVVGLCRRRQILGTVAAAESVIWRIPPATDQLLHERVVRLEAGLQEVAGDPSAAEAVLLAELAAGLAGQQQNVAVSSGQVLGLRPCVAKAPGVGLGDGCGLAQEPRSRG